MSTWMTKWLGPVGVNPSGITHVWSAWQPSVIKWPYVKTDEKHLFVVRAWMYHNFTSIWPLTPRPIAFSHRSWKLRAGWIHCWRCWKLAVTIVLRRRQFDIHVMAGQECCSPEVNACADVQYLHLWDEESRYILSNVVDFIEIRGRNNMPINMASIQTLLVTWGLGQQKIHEVQDRQIQGFHTDL